MKDCLGLMAVILIKIVRGKLYCGGFSSLNKRVKYVLNNGHVEHNRQGTFNKDIIC